VIDNAVDNNPRQRLEHQLEILHKLVMGLPFLVLTISSVKFILNPTTAFLDIPFFHSWKIHHLLIWSSVFFVVYFKMKNAGLTHIKLRVASLVLLSVNFLWEAPFFLMVLTASRRLINPFDLSVSIMTLIISGFVPVLLLLVYMKKHTMNLKKVSFTPYLLCVMFYFLNFYGLLNVHFPLLPHLMRLSMALPFIEAICRRR